MLTVTRGEAGGDNGWETVFRNIYKGHMDKTKWGYDQGWGMEMAGVGGVGGSGDNFI